MRLRATRLAGLGHPKATEPPSEPGDPYWDKVVALLHFDGEPAASTFVDSSSYAHTPVAVGAAALAASPKKFGNTALYLDGNASSVTVPDHPSFAIPGDFTIEGWFRPSTVFGTRNYLTFGSGLNLFVTSGQLQLWTGASGLAVRALQAETWYHLAVARQGSTTRVFVNGELKLTTAAVSGARAASALLIGAYPSSPSFAGGIDDIRFTVGVARYTESFTPPTAPFPSSAAPS